MPFKCNLQRYSEGEDEELEVGGRCKSNSVENPVESRVLTELESAWFPSLEPINHPI